MSASRWFMALGIGASLLAGCDSKPAPSHAQQTPPPAATTTQPAEQASAVIAAPATAATSRPVPDARSFTVLENNVLRTYDFPHARLHIDKEQKTAVLYSDDPKSAINPNYAGNNYYMVIPLTEDFVDHLDGYQWHFKAASSEHQNSDEGIFLEGNRYHLEPSEMVIGFQGDGPRIRVGLDGNFFKFDINQPQPQREGSLVRVKGIVNATVIVK